VYEVQEASTTFRPEPAAAARAASGVAGDPAVLWVGRLNANKDPLTALAGFERTLAAFPAARLTMVFGADDLLGDVRARIRESPALDGRVRLVGRVPHDRLPAFYSAADVFLLASRHEGSGYALVEACACGATPVVTDIPSFRAMTGRGSIGGLWTPGDAGACARALTAAAGAAGPPARAAVLAHFARAMSWRATARRAMEAYADAAGRRRAAIRGRAGRRAWQPGVPQPTRPPRYW
jgi:glycosyltransferase involved in cell wall biosynthesis